MAINPASLKVGDVIIAEGGFNCLSDGQQCLVKADDEHGLFVACARGRHFLSGQYVAGEIVGFHLPGKGAHDHG